MKDADEVRDLTANSPAWHVVRPARIGPSDWWSGTIVASVPWGTGAVKLSLAFTCFITKAQTGPQSLIIIVVVFRCRKYFVFIYCVPGLSAVGLLTPGVIPMACRVDVLVPSLGFTSIVNESSVREVG